MFIEAAIQAAVQAGVHPVVKTWTKLVLALKQEDVNKAILPDRSFMMQGVVEGYQSNSSNTHRYHNTGETLRNPHMRMCLF